MAIVFQHDDDAYLEWLDAHATGYVVNMGRKEGELVLHRTECSTLKRQSNKALTEHPKLCANTVANLRAYVRSHITGANDFSKRCSLCKPG